jgi:ferredoxin
MPNKNDKWEDNNTNVVTFDGKKISFYVDRDCIFCNVCEEEAPNNFKESDDETHDIVYKQPENKEELNECYIAMESCPVDAIGDDGDNS